MGFVHDATVAARRSELCLCCPRRYAPWGPRTAPLRVWCTGSRWPVAFQIHASLRMRACRNPLNLLFYGTVEAWTGCGERDPEGDAPNKEAVQDGEHGTGPRKWRRRPQRETRYAADRPFANDRQSTGWSPEKRRTKTGGSVREERPAWSGEPST